MTDIEKKAKEYAEEQISGMEFANDYERTCEIDNYRCAFLAGAKFALANQWRDIPHGKDGSVDEAQLDEMKKHTPVVLRRENGDMHIVSEDGIVMGFEHKAWIYNEIRNSPWSYAWLPIPEYKPKEQEI